MRERRYKYVASNVDVINLHQRIRKELARKNNQNIEKIVNLFNIGKRITELRIF